MCETSWADVNTATCVSPESAAHSLDRYFDCLASPLFTSTHSVGSFFWEGDFVFVLLFDFLFFYIYLYLYLFFHFFQKTFNF